MSNVDCVEHGSCVRRAIAAIAVSGTDAVAPIRGIETMTLWSTEEIEGGIRKHSIATTRVLKTFSLGAGLP